MNKKSSKIISKLIVFIISIIQIFNFSTFAFANGNYDYSNQIYTNGIEDTFVYDSTDSVVITKTNIPRNIPKETGRYDISKYPIPLINTLPDEQTFELIKAENKEIMDNVEEDIKNGTLTKHIAADGQFFGTVTDDVLGVEKKIYINTNSKGSHSLASYVPAGEIATVKLNDEALVYAKKGKIKISVGMTMTNADNYKFNKNEENRMPYLGKTFSINQNETKVGTPFGGMIYIDIDDSVPSGLKVEAEVSGVIDTPYYDLGKTTDEEWEASKSAPGLFAEIRTPSLRFMVPSKYIRDIDNIYDALQFWENSVAISANTMGLQYRTKPITLIFDQYIRAGSAFALVGAWTCNLPPSWITSALDYDVLTKGGNWGLIHEINHHYQGRYNNYFDEWGLGNSGEFSEITNNALSALAYILYTNIAAYRDENGTSGYWTKVADPYSSLKEQIYESDQKYKDKSNIGAFMYSTFAHEIGPINFANVVKSTYEGGTFNGIEVKAYDYKLESQGGLERNDRYDDLAYRLCIAGGRDYTWYMQNELAWPLKEETINKIKQHGFEEYIPVQSVYGVGEVGRETGRTFYIPSSGYVFDFEKSLVSPGEVSVVGVSNPKYGTLTKNSDGKYQYKLNSSIPENAVDEFILTVEVKAGDIVQETKINCQIGIEYNRSEVEKFAITKWDIHEALADLKGIEAYSTSSINAMKINADNGNNLTRAKGYFVVEKSGEYEFQAFGDNRAVFELHLEDGTTLQSLTEDYSVDANEAQNLANSTKFTAKLEANKQYSYTLICNNNGGSGWADVSIKNTSENSSWQSISEVKSVKVEKFAITKWDIHEALEDLNGKEAYSTSSISTMKINTDDGNNLARAKGYFVVENSGEYEFQVFGDDRAVFELHQEDGTTLQSLTEDYSADANQAQNLANSTKFTVKLEANKQYSYTLICNNNSGSGWADVNIKNTSENSSWESISEVKSVNLEKYAITKWDIHEALEVLNGKKAYNISSVNAMKIYADDGNNLTRAKGYFVVEKSGEYEFQAFGDDRAVFELHLEDGTTLQSLTPDYSSDANVAQNLTNSTKFTAKLEANKQYSYTLICNNNAGSGWADVNIKNTSENSSWESISEVKSVNLEKYAITKWDIHEALQDLNGKKAYNTSSTNGMRIYSDDGNNLARAKGYFVVDKSGEYEFQAFGDDRAVFELHLEDGTTLQSLTEDYSADVNGAQNLANSTKFTAKLEANKPYSYTLICNNNGGIGWADVNIKNTSENSSWESIRKVYSNLDDVGKDTDRTFTMPEPEYVRPHSLAAGHDTEIKNMTVLSTPQGVIFNGDPNSANEGNKESIVDGDLNTYFHSSYDNNNRTPFPHEYVIDLGGEKSFNNLEIYTRRTGEAAGVIGDYEIYVADEYDKDNTNWTKIADDYTRKGNSNASSDIKISLQPTTARYLKIKALNNRSHYNLTIIAEVKLSNKTNVKNVIAQNSSFIQYNGNWSKDSNGAFVNGATYNTTNGYFMYSFEGKESNIYATKNAEVEVRVDGGEWKKTTLVGSLRAPSVTLNMENEGKHIVEVRAIGEEISLNMISTDGIFIK